MPKISLGIQPLKDPGSFFMRRGEGDVKIIVSV